MTVPRPPHPGADPAEPDPVPAQAADTASARDQRHSATLPIDSAVLRRAVRTVGLPRVAADLLAACGVLGAVAGQRGPAVGALLSALVIVCVRGIAALRRSSRSGSGPTGSAVMARILVVLGLAAWSASGWFPVSGNASWTDAAAGGVVVAVLAETIVAPLARLAVPYVQNLPGVAVRNEPLVAARWAFVANTAGLVLLTGLGLDGRSGPAIVLIPSVQWLVAVVIVVDASTRIWRRRHTERRLGAALAEYGPTFLLHWYAPVGSSHQITMWLPYLERLGRPFAIVVRNPATFAELTGETSRPVLVRRYGSELAPLIVPSVRTVFYVNTSPRNEPMLAFLDLQQIQLNHGDSDKAPSYRRAFRTYDKNFVAGQAAIDRFASHGVEVPRSMFEIVGRPQIEAITVADVPIAHRDTKAVLYAPTWYGYLDDSRYSSLSIGVAIVTALLDRGCTVIFRPHPWTDRAPELAEQARRINALLREDATATGRTHSYGQGALQHRSLIDCFNAAHAMIADVSSVVSDFLYAEKPYAITVMQSGQTTADVLRELPLARGGYLLRADRADWPRALDDLLIFDPKLLERRTLRSYYLGPFPTGGYADGFLSVARGYV